MICIPTILVVDDEISVIDQVKLFLKNESIDVISAENTRQAVEFIDDTTRKKVDLVLVNTFIPGSDQKAFFSLKPTTRFQDSTNDQLLPKPFTQEQLLSYIRNKI